MAEQPSKINVALAKVGMDKDTHPSQLNETQYTHAINANVETESGNSLNITNEKSNILITRYKPGFVLIGFENDILSNDTYVFLVNPTTGVGEFGVIKDNQNITNLEDITALCGDCQEVRELAIPLESIVQEEIEGVYETLISDESALDSSSNTCLNRSNPNYNILRLGFNFNANYPIKKLVIKNEKCGKTIYFTDNFNPPRHINIENISQYYVQNVPCDDDITTDCIDFDELRIFKLYNIPQITPTSIQLGGELRMGMYEFLLAYCDAAGNEISPYYSITRPVSVFDKNNLIQGQENIADRTNFSIKLEVSGLDKRYSHYKVAVIQTADIEGVTRYFQEGIHTTNDNTVIYGSEQDKIATSIDKLLIDNLKVEQSEGLTASNNILFQYGLTLKKEINLQPVVNFMGQFLKWQTHIATENLYENGVIGSQYIGYNRDEVVPFGIRFSLLGGYETSIFPFIARAPKDSDLESMLEEETGNAVDNNVDVQSILDNVLDCNTTERTKKWQYYNTAEVDDNTLCEEIGVVYEDVVNPITKVCVLEDIIEVPSGSFVIDLMDDEYTNLEEYIDLKKENCPYEFYDEEGNLSNLCSYLEETQYDGIICGEDLYANIVDKDGNTICDTPETDTEIELSKVESVVSGSGESGFIDGDTLTSKFYAPRNTVIDSLGNLFITDSVNNAIRKVSTDGTVTTFAGSTSGTPGFSDATGNAATFNIPYGMTIDSSDNLYITEIGNHAIRKITPSGVVTTLAGSGTSGSTDGTGTSATFNSPFNITIDSTSTYLYVADTGNHKIRKVTLTGVVTTFAGTGTPGFENGAGLTVAKFEQPFGITISSDGKIYVTDFINNAVRRITTAGVVTTVTTSISKLEQPRGIAISSDNSTLYVSDSINHSIRKIQISSGNITDFAGNGINGFVNEFTIYAQFNQPFGLNIIDTDPLNSFIYISDTGNNVIRKISITTGIVTTFAGKSTFTYKPGAREEKVEKIFPAEYQVVTNPVFCNIYKTSDTQGGYLIDEEQPLGVYYGNPNPIKPKEVYVRDSQFLNQVCTNAEEIKNNTKTNPNDASTAFFNNYYAQQTGEVTTFAGSANESGQDDGEDITAKFNNPSGVVSDSFGNIYISDKTNHSIRKITPSGVVTTFAGTSGTSGSTNGVGTAASFNEPYGIAIDSTSTFLYVTDYGNNKIRKIEIATAVVSDFVTITEPRGITVSTIGDCYITAENRVVILSSTGSTIVSLDVFTINGIVKYFASPYGIAIKYNSSGVVNGVYIADTGNHVIRLMGRNSNNMSNYAGVEGDSGFINAAKASAKFGLPRGLVIDSQGNLYVSDSGNHAIRKVTSTRVSTIAGTGALGTNDGTGWEAEFNKPIGLCIIPSTIYPSSYTMYITDSDSHTIRKIVSSPESLLYTNKTSTQFYYPVVGVEAQFYPQLSKNTIWFKGDTEGKDRFILDLSIQKDVSGDDFISVGSYVRLSIFKKCTSSQAIHSRLVDLSDSSGAGMFLLEKKNTSDLLITDLLGNSTLIVDGWFANKKFLVAIDTPIALMKKELESGAASRSNLVDVWVNSPTDGCFSLTKRDIEFSRIFVSWDNIKLSKKIIYTANCTFSEPIPQSCKATPYKIGTSAFWESEQKYPDNNELYNSANLVIKEDRIEGLLSSLTDETITEFKEVFTDGTTEDGNYIFKSEPWQDTTKKVADFTCRNIRHFKFPDNKIAPFVYDQQKAPLLESAIYPMGITIDENVINTFLDIAVDNNLLSPEDRKKILSYEIFRGDISLDRSVVASGLLFDMRRYSENNREVYYSNYPYNTYSKDVLNLDSLVETTSKEPSVWGSSNRNYTFHSPETDYGKPTLPSELSVQGYMFGSSSGYFDEVKQHPKWVILSNSAYVLAGSLATLEVVAESVMALSQVISSGASAFSSTVFFFGGAGFAGGSVQANPIGAGLAIGATAAVAAVQVATSIVYKYGRYRYDWLKIFRDLGSPHNFAYYYFSEGFYNYMNVETEPGSNLRALNIAKYLSDGRYNVTNEVTRENLKVNNIDRENTVLISTGKSLIVYPENYKDYDKSDSSLTTMSLAGLNQKGRSSEITKFVASPYVALKNYLPSQHNSINSIKWITTSFIGDLTSLSSNCIKVLPIFGGDTFISRHSFKRKIPLFLVTAMKQADLTPFNYFYYSNIGRNPKYYVSYEQNKDFSSGGKLFPEIASDFSFDNKSSSGNYYTPPSKFYLYYYGVPNFLTETRINTNYRYSGKEKKESFYPVCGDLGEWTQESVVPIREPNIFKYNTVYSKNSTFIRSRTLSPTYNRDFDDCVQDMPNGIMASLKDSTENSIYDPWLIYRPLDTFEFPSNYGKLKDIIDVESGAILARFDNTSVLYNKIDTKIDTGSAITATVLGGNMFFQRASTSFVNAKIGYGGTQNFASISCEAGHFWVDAKRGQVLMLPPNSSGIQEISTSIGGKPSGLRNWFKEHLPFKILKSIPNADVDNPYNGVGITMGWDSRYRRVFITKKDYIPKPCVEFVEGVGYVCVEVTGKGTPEQETVVTPVSVTNTNYFEDVSWTIAFSLNTGSWMSYYSFHPNYYISHNTYFQTGRNNAVDSSELGLWSHLLTNKSYQVFYGKKYPFVVEYPIKSEYATKRLGSVKLWTEAKRYSNEYDFSTNPDFTFNKSMVYNNVGCSGQLILDVQKPNLANTKEYPKTNQNGTQNILITCKDNFQFTYDYIFNRIKYNNTNIPFLLQDKNQIEKSPNSAVVKFYGINPLKKMEGDWFLNRLTYDTDSRFSLTLKFILNVTQNT